MVDDGGVYKVSTISRAANTDKIKSIVYDKASTTPDADIVKLHVKRVSSRLYNAVKDIDNRDGIKTAIIEFMDSIYDLNHLIKIEKELLFELSL